MNQLIDALIGLSIRWRQIVLLASLALFGSAGFLLRSASVDALPSFTPPTVTVQSEARGMGSAEVEERITAPLEQALLGTPELVRLRSTSSPDLSWIELMFSDQTDIFRARQLVSERLALARERLPPGLPGPALAPISAPVSALLRFCLTPADESADAMRELTRFAYWRLRPRLQAIGGVSRVTVHGAAELRIEVRPDPAAMIARGITLSELRRTLAEAQGLFPLGYAAAGDERQPLRIDSLWTVGTLESIGATVLDAQGGTPVRVSDVATVALAEAPAVGAALYDAAPAIYLQIDKLPWSDTLRVTQELEAALRELDRDLPSGARRRPPVLRQADFVATSIGAVGRALALGAVLVAIVLTAFLRSGRLVAITLLALPLSILAALVVLLARGVTLNGMLLGGLAIAVGEVVDDAIVDVENIARRLRENAAAGSSRPALEVIRSASAEIRGAVVYATVIVIAVLAPIILLRGLAGRIFSPLAQAYAFAMAASLLVALTVTPALCALLLPREAASLTAAGAEPALTRRLRRAYDWLLAALVRRPGAVLGGSALLGLSALGALPWLGGGFLPEFREGVLIADVSAWPGTSLDETARLAKRLDAQLRGPGGLPHVSARLGRASLDEDAAPVHRIEMDLVLPADAYDPEQSARGLERLMFTVPGVRFTVEGFLGERINELLSGERAPIAVKLSGPDLEPLRQRARELVPLLASIPGVESVHADAWMDVPTQDLRLDDANLAVLGLKRSDVAASVAAFRQGLDVAQARAPGGFSLPVAIAGQPELRSLERLEDLPVFAASGAVLPLSAAVTVSPGREPAAIRHEDGRRVVSLIVDADSAELSHVAERIERTLEQSARLPTGASFRIAGQAAERGSASLELGLIVSAVLCAVLVFLWIAFDSWLDAVVVLAGLPLGLVGGVIAALWMPGGLSLAGMVGFVTLLGIISRNGIMLVTHKNQLLAASGGPAVEALILTAARERLVPISMTAGAAFVGLLPLAFSIRAAGSELEAPMACIVCGGLFTSTLMNLIAVPAFYLWRARRGGT